MLLLPLLPHVDVVTDFYVVYVSVRVARTVDVPVGLNYRTLEEEVREQEAQKT